MKKIYMSLMALVAAFAITSCNEATEQQARPTEKSEIRFSAQVGDYTRVTEYSFEEGDQVSLIAFAQGEQYPYINNACFSYSNNEFQGDQPYYWHEDPNATTVFYAFYPYIDILSEAEDYSLFSAGVELDQSTEWGYKQSDLLLAVASSTYTEEAVLLDFFRINSRLDVHINNELGEEITEVMLGNLHPYSIIQFLPNQGTYGHGDAQANGIEPDARVDIRAGRMIDGWGDDYWSVILPVQLYADPTITVTLASGEQRKFLLEGEVDLLPGNRFSTTITLREQEEPTPIAVEWSINDWIDGGDLVFENPQVDADAAEVLAD